MIKNVVSLKSSPMMRSCATCVLLTHLIYSWLVNCVLLRDADEACEENAGGNEARVC